MTPKQRAQVVELLRCAADDDGRNKDCPHGLIEAQSWLESPFAVESNAWAAYDAARLEMVGGYRTDLLEAAARVEAKEWP